MYKTEANNIHCDENHNYFQDESECQPPEDQLAGKGEHHPLDLASSAAINTVKINNFVVQEKARAPNSHTDVEQKDNRRTSDEKAVSEEYVSSDDEVPLASLLTKSGKKISNSMVWEDVLPMHRCHHCSYASKKRYLLFRHLKVHGEDNHRRKTNSKGDKRDDFVQGHEKGCLNLDHEKSSATTYHNEGEILPVVTYTCDFCSYKTNKRYLLTRHSRIHTGDRPYKCEICERKFTMASALKVHINMHNGVKKYKCDYCDRSFTTKGEMKRHVKYKHTLLKPHKCTECIYTAVERCKIVRHMRCHTNNDSVKITPSQLEPLIDTNYTYEPNRSAISIQYCTYIPSP